MSPVAGTATHGFAEPECDCPAAAAAANSLGAGTGVAHFHMTAQGLAPVPNVDGSGPCCDAPQWPACRDCPHYPAVGRLLEEMAEQRPPAAPPLHLLGEAGAVEACQMDAFEAGDAQWWRYGEDYVTYARDADGNWVAEAEESADGAPMREVAREVARAAETA